MTLLEAALRYAQEGVATFPVGLDKKPRNTNGFHGATTDSDTIRGWEWEGIGAAIPEGQFVVDIDPRHGGDATWTALVEAGCSFPGTRTHSTRSDGTHRFYKLPAELVGRSLKGSLGPGLDIKAAGKGYVLMPPTPGYSVRFNTPVAEAPEWMLEELLKPDVEHVMMTGSAPKFFEAFESGTGYGIAAMEAEMELLQSAQEGGRNNALNRAVFAMAQLAAGGELDGEATLQRLEEAALTLGLEEDEIRITIASGWAAGSKEPRQAPETVPYKAADFQLPVPAEDATYWLNWDIDEPEPPYYLRPILPKNAYVLVYGATESSKSMAILALLADASRNDIKCSIYSLENPSHIDRDRVRRLRPNSDNFRITNQPIDLNDSEQVHEMVERNRATGKGSWPDGSKSDLVVLDTYSHSFNSRSEDGNAKAIEFARRIRYIMHEVGCTFIVVDHTGYADHGEPRDASAKRQQVDVAIYMEKQGEWRPGHNSMFKAENKKSARFGNPFEYTGEIQDILPRSDDRLLKLEWRHAHGGDFPRWE